jgi:putative glutamine amidotransferase
VTRRRPLIGLTGRRKVAAAIAGTPASLHHLEGDWYYADYARAVYEAGGLPVHLSLDVDPADVIGHLAGVLLSGGADVDPEQYAAAVDADCGPIEPERDEFELALVDAAMDMATPVLGVCRGMQLLNVAAGGTLHQHVPEHLRYDVAPTERVHDVELVEGSQLHRLYGPTTRVNSLHHQTVDIVGTDLDVTARSGDVVEGLEHNHLPILAVQWHPEMMTTRATDPLFAWLVEQAART